MQTRHRWPLKIERETLSQAGNFRVWLVPSSPPSCSGRHLLLDLFPASVQPALTRCREVLWTSLPFLCRNRAGQRNVGGMGGEGSLARKVKKAWCGCPGCLVNTQDFLTWPHFASASAAPPASCLLPCTLPLPTPGVTDPLRVAPPRAPAS